MENVKDFFKEFKDRLTSPFFGSYIITWLIINWRIPLTLVFYKQEDLHLDGYNSYMSLVVDNINWCNGIIFPLISAFFYTFGYPWFRDFIKKTHAKWARATDEKLLKISKDGYVSVARHIELKELYEESISKITDFFSNQNTIQQDLIKSQEDLSAANELIIKANKEKADISDSWEKMIDHNAYNGNWEVNTTMLNGTVVRQLWEFYNGGITIGESNERLAIKYITVNIHSKLISMYLEKFVDGSKSFGQVLTLNYDETFNILSGTSTISSYREVKMIRA